MSVVKFNTLTSLNIECRSYFNSDNDSGIEVKVDEVYLGKMVGVSLVYEDDEEEEFLIFVDMVDTWIIENE